MLFNFEDTVDWGETRDSHIGFVGSKIGLSHKSLQKIVDVNNQFLNIDLQQR